MTGYARHEVCSEQLNISSGIAFKTTSIYTLDELIERADKMLYQAMDSGRNVVMVDKNFIEKTNI